MKWVVKMSNVNILANLYYNFINDYNKFKNNNNEIKLPTCLIEKWYNDETIFFMIDKNSKEALKTLENKLSSKKGTLDLINKLELTFQDSNDYIQLIDELYYLTKDLVDQKQLEIIVKRKFYYDDNFKKKNYFKLYLKYKNLYDELDKHLKNF